MNGMNNINYFLWCKTAAVIKQLRCRNYITSAIRHASGLLKVMGRLFSALSVISKSLCPVLQNKRYSTTVFDRCVYAFIFVRWKRVVTSLIPILIKSVMTRCCSNSTGR